MFDQREDTVSIEDFNNQKNHEYEEEINKNDVS